MQAAGDWESCHGRDGHAPPARTKEKKKLGYEYADESGDDAVAVQPHPCSEGGAGQFRIGAIYPVSPER